MPKNSAKKPSFYQIKITLANSPLPIWRRLLVNSEISLSMLHEVFQMAMGWWDYHFYEFKKGDSRYGIMTDFDEDLDLQDADLNTLSSILKKPGEACTYIYDFGDDWSHEVILEKIITRPQEDDKTLALCLHGKRACPPEDCGGIPGFTNFLTAIEDPMHPEHQDMVEWTGASYDPNIFDCRGVNLRLILWTNDVHDELELVEAMAAAESSKKKTGSKKTDAKGGNLLILNPQKPKK